jgi:hypothetical protein
VQLANVVWALGNRLSDQVPEAEVVHVIDTHDLGVPHSLAATGQESLWIVKRGAEEETQGDVTARSSNVDNSVEAGCAQAVAQGLVIHKLVQSWREIANCLPDCLNNGTLAGIYPIDPATYLWCRRSRRHGQDCKVLVIRGKRVGDIDPLGGGVDD